MYQLGKVLHISKNRTPVLQFENIIPKKEKATVFTKSEKKVGTISEIFGPVKKPYATVKLQKGIDAEKLVGDVLYVK
ncbi:MAG: H/ACA RNA-protein complex protein Gar1 [archaeon]